ncbi:prorelaxin H1 [Pseudoliparis swirei]|uniref:prorelaxin H1 n=1 Tax=Pseudoliparis swirei TaxID=2059687 RepID=UPI0024BDDC46|nr:prorelaxin H1 [Pseudoliparis swirei]
MLWRLTLAVAVVCAGGVCRCVKADLMGRSMLPRDSGVKLCGREFIRAVIFTCGGSRWKRSTLGDTDPFQWSSLSDVSVQDKHHAWQTGPELPEDDRSALGSSLADLLALYGARGDGKQPPPPTTHSARRPSHAVTGERDGNREVAAGRTRGKQKRNFSLGVAGKCCNHGCTKNDIGRVC